MSRCNSCINLFIAETHYSGTKSCAIIHRVDTENVINCSHFEEKECNASQIESLESFHKKMIDGDYPRFCGWCGSKLGSNKLKAICKKCEKDLLKKGE